MALREIHTYPSEVLKRRARAVETVGDGERRLIADMLETMHAAPGIGLAAPQVGVSLRVIVVDLSAGGDSDAALALVNPEIVSREGESEADEGCLSLPDLTVRVRRAERVTVEALDALGEPVRIEAANLMARALQHEIDHLDGFLLVDRLNPVRREIVKKKLRKAVAARR